MLCEGGLRKRRSDEGKDVSADASNFLANLAKAEARFVDRAKTAIGAFAAMVVGNAQQLAPVDTGMLKASGVWTPVVVAAGTITCEVGFNMDYAAAVHERLNVRHRQGQAKYLETAMVQLAPKFQPLVESQLNKGHVTLAKMIRTAEKQRNDAEKRSNEGS